MIGNRVLLLVTSLSFFSIAQMKFIFYSEIPKSPGIGPVNRKNSIDQTLMDIIIVVVVVFIII